jgi:hypothetical protein
MKKSSLPMFAWIDKDSTQVTRWLGIVSSGLVALGLHWNFSYDHAANGTFVFTLTGVTLASLLEHARDWGISYASQQVGYHVGEVPELLKCMKVIIAEQANVKGKLEETKAAAQAAQEPPQDLVAAFQRLEAMVKAQMAAAQ